MSVELVDVSSADLHVLAALMDHPHEYPPSVRALGERVGYRSSSTTHDHLRALRAAGLVDWVDGHQRTLHATVRAVPHGRSTEACYGA